MQLDEWKKKNSLARKYAHFDEKVSFKQVWQYISNPEMIASHSFYPFIHYTAESVKFSKEKGGKKPPKKRQIYYSAHIDRYIFQYYGYLLNEKYNERADFLGINKSSIAYRNNLHKSNIDFAEEAFDFIRSNDHSFIMVGDFTDFFDSLSHSYLKARLCDLLEMDKLPDDYYAVYKNITKYAYWELENLLILNDMKNTRPDYRKLNEQRRVITQEIFKAERGKQIKTNPNKYGIPQGSSISAVLSNIYMISFDKIIADYAKKNNGLYLRYSDDFIFIIPVVDTNRTYKDFQYFMHEILEIDKLILQPEKTQCFVYENETLENCNSLYLKNVPNSRNLLNYLGFSFDGKAVRIRDKTISKYYYKMYRKIRGIKERDEKISPDSRKTSLHSLYDSFSYKGLLNNKVKNQKRKGNFLSYVNRSSLIFKDDINIKNSTRRHMQKIRKRLKS